MDTKSNPQEKVLVSPSAKNLATMLVEESYSPTDLEPKKVKEERIGVEIQKGIDETSRNLNMSIVHLENALKKHEFSSEGTSNALIRIKEQAAYIKDHFDEMLQKLEQEQVTFSDTVKVDEDSLDRMYKAAKALYDENLYKEAILVFNLLVLLEPDQPVFWMGLGHAAFISDNYDDALQAFKVASSIEPENPVYELMIAKCHEQLKEYNLAIDVLDQIINRLGKDPEFDSIKEQVREIREEISFKSQNHV